LVFAADTTVKGIVALASLPIPVLAAAFWHIRVYSIYRVIGERWPEIEQMHIACGRTLNRS
jgi:hypothetical protein